MLYHSVWKNTNIGGFIRYTLVPTEQAVVLFHKEFNVDAHLCHFQEKSKNNETVTFCGKFGFIIQYLPQIYSSNGSSFFFH